MVGYAWHVAHMEEMRNVCNSLAKIIKGKGLFRDCHEWKDVVKLDFEETKYEGMKRTELAQDRAHARLS
jgi:hypothetical protein